MSEGFANSIIGGAETLIRSAIKSVNYVLGIAGWRITRAGSAEFSDATIRGSISADNGNITLNNGGLKVLGATTQYDINKSAGFLARDLPDDGVSVQINPNYVILSSQNPSPAGGTPTFAQLTVGYFNSGLANEQPDLVIFGNGYSGLGAPFLAFAGQALNDAGTDETSYIDHVAALVKINGVDTGWGTVSAGGMSASSAAIGNTETDLFTCDNYTFKAGRAYAIRANGMHTASVAGNRPIYRLRKTSGGTQIQARSIFVGTAGSQNQADWLGLFYVSGSDVNCSPVMSAMGSGTFTVTVLGPYGCIIEDIGPASRVSSFAFQLT